MDLLEQLADATGVAEVEVEIVHHEQEDAPRSVGDRARRRQDDALLRSRRRRRRDVEHASAMHEREGDDLLLHAVLEDFEVVLLEIGDEHALVVAGDDVGGDEVDPRRECRLFRRGRGGRGRRRGRRRRWRLLRAEADDRARDHETPRGGTHTPADGTSPTTGVPSRHGVPEPGGKPQLASMPTVH